MLKQKNQNKTHEDDGIASQAAFDRFARGIPFEDRNAGPEDRKVPEVTRVEDPLALHLGRTMLFDVQRQSTPESGGELPHIDASNN